MKILLILHAVASVALLGAATHNGILALRHLLGHFDRPPLQRRYAQVMFWLYLIVFIIGLAIYPLFRITVRAALFDVHMPLVTGFFEVKEHWLGLGLVVLLWYFPTSRSIDIRHPQAWHKAYHISGLLLMLVIWMAGITGFVLVALKSL